MKYIRTKDKIEKVPDYYANKLVEYPNLKIADTIEELCDGFIVEEKDNETNWFVMEMDELKNMPQEQRIFELKNWNHYAFIKTNKGLVYVAKLNNKGELELL